MAFKKNVNHIYLRGTFNNWGLSPLVLKDDHLWQLAIHLPIDSTEFKFDVYGDWSLNYGSRNQDQFTDRNGGNIKVRSGKGNYLITFNDLSLVYSIEKQLSNNRPPRANAGTDIVINEGEYAKFSAVRSHDFDGKIVAYQWSNGLQGVTPKKRYQMPGSYSVVLTVTDDKGATGTDDVLLLVNAIGTKHNFKQLYLRGTNNDWRKTKLVAKEDYIWELETHFEAGVNQRFKFDHLGDWKNNFGDNNDDGFADKNGKDIPVSNGEGNYKIIFNDQTLKFSIEKLP